MADKARLRNEADKLIVELKTTGYLPFRYPQPTIFETGTGGWMVKIATWKDHPRIEVWLDKFISQERRHFWFGFANDDPTALLSLENSAPTQCRSDKQYTDDDLRLIGNIEVLASPPTDEDIMRPVFERYYGDSYYGMYDKGSHGSPSAHELDVVRAANFIRSVAGAQIEIPEYIGSEGGKRHLWIERQIRDDVIARRRKRHDRFICQVCDFNFEEQYGENGKEFAECHHLVPFAKNKKARVTKIGDLRTVCANCHRMLHRMEGRGEADIFALKELVRVPWKRQT